MRVVGDIAKERAKKHETRGADITSEEGAIIQGGGNELKQVVQFRLEKLGCKIVKNCIAGWPPLNPPLTRSA